MLRRQTKAGLDLGYSPSLVQLGGPGRYEGLLQQQTVKHGGFSHTWMLWQDKGRQRTRSHSTTCAE